MARRRKRNWRKAKRVTTSLPNVETGSEEQGTTSDAVLVLSHRYNLRFKGVKEDKMEVDQEEVSRNNAFESMLSMDFIPEGNEHEEEQAEAEDINNRPKSPCRQVKRGRVNKGRREDVVVEIRRSRRLINRNEGIIISNFFDEQEQIEPRRTRRQPRIKKEKVEVPQTQIPQLKQSEIKIEADLLEEDDTYEIVAEKGVAAAEITEPIAGTSSSLTFLPNPKFVERRIKEESRENVVVNLRRSRRLKNHEKEITITNLFEKQEHVLKITRRHYPRIKKDKVATPQAPQLKQSELKIGPESELLQMVEVQEEDKCEVVSPVPKTKEQDVAGPSAEITATAEINTAAEITEPIAGPSSSLTAQQKPIETSLQIDEDSVPSASYPDLDVIPPVGLDGLPMLQAFSNMNLNEKDFSSYIQAFLKNPASIDYKFDLEALQWELEQCLVNVTKRKLLLLDLKEDKPKIKVANTMEDNKKKKRAKTRQFTGRPLYAITLKHEPPPEPEMDETTILNDKLRNELFKFAGDFPVKDINFNAVAQLWPQFPENVFFDNVSVPSFIQWEESSEDDDDTDSNVSDTDQPLNKGESIEEKNISMNCTGKNFVKIIQQLEAEAAMYEFYSRNAKLVLVTPELVFPNEQKKKEKSKESKTKTLPSLETKIRSDIDELYKIHFQNQASMEKLKLKFETKLKHSELERELAAVDEGLVAISKKLIELKSGAGRGRVVPQMDPTTLNTFTHLRGVAAKLGSFREEKNILLDKLEAELYSYIPSE